MSGHTFNPEQAHLHDPALLERWFEKLGRTIAIDFDGVLHPYTEGWVGSTPADEPPMPGALEFLQELHGKGYTLVVFSTRADHEAGHAGIVAWLDEHGLGEFIERVTAMKPAAIAYVDDRAVPFTGHFGAVLDGIDRLAEGRAHGAAPR